MAAIDELRLTVNGDGNGNPGLVRKVDRLTTAIEALEDDRKERRAWQRWITQLIIGTLVGVVLTALCSLVGLGLIAFTAGTRGGNQASTQTASPTATTTTVIDTGSDTPTPATVPPGATHYTSDELAALERVTARTIRERAARGEYGDAASKDASGQWRFDRVMIDAKRKPPSTISTTPTP